MALSACNASYLQSEALLTTTTCKGIYYTRDSIGNLYKWRQYWLESAHACFTDNLPLSHWELTSEAWRKNNVRCTPQTQFSSRTLVTANNYYRYADGKVHLDLNSSTGVYRKLTLTEDRDGNPVYTKLQGCFYQRSSPIYGDQILLDTDIARTASSQSFDPTEIFTYTTSSANSIEMVRFDDVTDWDYRFCPVDSTSWGYCDLLRSGNEMFFPALTNAQKDSLTREAKLIRQMFNYVVANKNAFDDLWVNSGNNRIEAVREDYRYTVQPLPDTPQYIWSAWRDYVMGNRTTPPTN